MIPPELESSATGEIAPLKDDLPWFLDPKHIKITLTYGADDPPAGSQIAIYRVAEFRAADKQNNLAKLQTFLSRSEQPVDARQLPLVPWLNATPLIAAQLEPIQFETGRGMRFVTEYAQEAAPITNRGLIYQFQGLTSDKRFSIIGVLPIRSPVLVDEAAPGVPVPDGGVPFPGVDSHRLTDYWAQITEVLDAKHSADFSPSLQTIDSLIASIEVG